MPLNGPLMIVLQDMVISAKKFSTLPPFHHVISVLLLLLLFTEDSLSLIDLSFYLCYCVTSFPVMHTGSCPRPWIPYLGHCYYLNRAKKTWLEARDACRRDGGDLMSILNIEEQSFAISQLGYCKFPCRCITILHF